MLNPLISVMIPVYNREKYIQEAIDSVVAQDYRPLEIIVVDDGSTDRTAEIINQYDPKIVKYYYQDNAGIASARNTCFTHSSGEFLAWLDSDDYYLPGKLTAQMQYLSDNPKCDIVFTLAEGFFDDKQSENRIRNHRLYKHLSPVSESRVYLSTTLARRAMIMRVGERNVSLKVNEDVEWLNRSKFIYHIDISHCLDKVYLRRRMHEKSVTCLKISQDFPLYPEIMAGQFRKKILEHKKTIYKGSKS